MINLLPMVSQKISAYIDPGTGSLIIQITIATFLGGLYMMKVYWRRVKVWFERFKKK